MSGYVATLEDCAGSIFNREKSNRISRLNAGSPVNIRDAWRIYVCARQYHESLKNFHRVLNAVFTGDEDATFYALDTMFVERAYLMDKDVQKALCALRQKCIAEEDFIRYEADTIENVAPKCGFLTSRILERAAEELGGAFEIMDSSLFAIEEVIGYAQKIKHRSA